MLEDESISSTSNIAAIHIMMVLCTHTQSALEITIKQLTWHIVKKTGEVNPHMDNQE